MDPFKEDFDEAVDVRPALYALARKIPTILDQRSDADRAMANLLALTALALEVIDNCGLNALLELAPLTGGDNG